MRIAIRRAGTCAALIAAAAALGACGGGGASAPPLRQPGPPGPTAAPAGAPLTIRVVPDATRTAQQTMTAAAGGTLRATGADGTTYTLVVPRGALSGDTQISMTPISTAAGIPFAATLRGGVQFAPEGLALATPATLTIKHATSWTASRRVAFGYAGAGDQFHLEPDTGDDATATLVVRHFSGLADVDAAPAEAVAATAAHAPSATGDSISQQIASLILAHRAGSIDQATFDVRMEQLATSAFETQIKPGLIAGLDSDAAFTAGVQAALGFQRQLEVSGFAPIEAAKTGPAINDYIARGLQNAIDRAYAACASQDYSAISKALSFLGTGQRLGFIPESQIDNTKFAPCAIYRVSATPDTATVDIGATQQYVAQLANEQGLPLANTDQVNVDWSSGDLLVATVSTTGKLQGTATGLKQGGTQIAPSLRNAWTATELGIGTTRVLPSTIAVRPPKGGCAAYGTVKHWTATVGAQYAQSASRASESAALDHGVSIAYDITGGSGAWQGAGNGGSAHVNDTYKKTDSFAPFHVHTTTATASGVGGGAAVSNLFVQMDLVACTYAIQAALNVEETIVADGGASYTTASYGDGVQVYGMPLPVPASAAVPAITGGTSLPAHGAGWSPSQPGTAAANTYSPALGVGSQLFGIVGETAQAGSADVTWTLTPAP